MFVATLTLLLSINCNVAKCGLADTSVGDVIDHLNQVLQDRERDAANDADAFAMKAVTELKLAMEDAVVLFSEELKKRVQELTMEEQNFLTRLSAMIDNEFESFKGGAEMFRAKLAISLHELANQLLGTKKIDFLIETIENLIYYEETGPVSIAFTGIGVADQSDQRQAKITKVALSGHDITDLVTLKPENNTTIKIDFPESALALVNPSKTGFTFVPLKIWSRVSKPGWFFGAFGSTREFQFETTLTVVPKQVGLATLKYEIPKFDWVDSDSDVKGEGYTSPHDLNYPRTPEHGTIIITAPQGKRVKPGSLHFEKFGYDMKWGGATWSSFDYPEDKHAPPPVITYNVGGGQQTKVEFSMWGKHFTIIPHYDLQVWKQVGVNETALGPETLVLQSALRFTIPREAVSWTLEGNTITKRGFSIREGEQPKYVQPISTPAGENINLSFLFSSLP